MWIFAEAYFIWLNMLDEKNWLVVCHSGNVALSVLMTAASTLSAVVSNSSYIIFFYLMCFQSYQLNPTMHLHTGYDPVSYSKTCRSICFCRCSRSIHVNFAGYNVILHLWRINLICTSIHLRVDCKINHELSHIIKYNVSFKIRYMTFKNCCSSITQLFSGKSCWRGSAKNKKGCD